jgi:Alpha/beta hydrolase family
MDENTYRRAERALWASLHAQPTEHWLELGRTGATVHVQEVGDGAPVVFVHGASTAGTSWASLAARLDEFRCILIDRPGCGLSPPLSEGLADMARLGRFADALVELSWMFGAPTESAPLLMRLAMQPLLGRLMTRIRPNERRRGRCSNRSAFATRSRADTSATWRWAGSCRRCGTAKRCATRSTPAHESSPWVASTTTRCFRRRCSPR